MSEIFDFEDRWPELFDRLDVRERNSVRQDGTKALNPPVSTSKT